MPAPGQLESEVAPTLSYRAPAPLSQQASAHLDMLRGIAAFAVLFEHWRGIFFVDWPQVHHRNLFLYIFYGSTKFGHQAVIVFFVLSGFLIGRTVLRAVWAGRWSGTRYAFHRLVRLELVLLPALALCWLWDSAGIHFFSPSPTYLGTSGISVLNYNVSQWLSTQIFFGNAAFLQTLVVPPLGSNNPLWSLANEFWYYALFPCLVICLASSFSWTRRLIAGAIMIALAIFIGKWMLGYYLIWLFGVLLIFLPAPHSTKNRSYPSLLIAAVLLVAVQLIVTGRFARLESWANTDFILAILVTVLLYSLLHYPNPVHRSYRKVAKYAAGFSYTLYLTHMPVMVFFAAWLNHRALPLARNFLVPTGVLCFTVAYSYGIAVIFEHNTDRVRKKLETIFFR